jgi:hypothetical protein
MVIWWERLEFPSASHDKSTTTAMRRHANDCSSGVLRRCGVSQTGHAFDCTGVVLSHRYLPATTEEQYMIAEAIFSLFVSLG